MLVLLSFVLLDVVNKAPIPVPATGPITIVALGDTGKGNEEQARVAAAVKSFCGKTPCHLGVLLGDNVYPSGLPTSSSPLFDDVVENFYGDLGFPFVMVLGNHDYGALGLGLDEPRADAQVERIASSPHLYMPARHWRLDLGRIEIVGLDTPSLFFMDAPSFAGGLGQLDDARRQERDVLKWTYENDAPFRIALGHHPVRSAGVHGDAGSYEGLPRGVLFSGGALRDFFDKRILGHFDLYLSGHDHNLEDAGDEKGTALFVSGAGAEARPHKARADIPFASSSLGFVVVDIDGARAHVRIFSVTENGSAVLIHERAISAS